MTTDGPFHLVTFIEDCCLLIEFKVHGLFGRLEFIVCLPLRLFHSLLTNCFEFSDKLLPSLPSPNGQSVVFSEVLGYLKGNSTVMRKPLSHIGVEIRIQRDVPYIV